MDYFKDIWSIIIEYSDKKTVERLSRCSKTLRRITRMKLLYYRQKRLYNIEIIPGIKIKTKNINRRIGNFTDERINELNVFTMIIEGEKHLGWKRREIGCIQDNSNGYRYYASKGKFWDIVRK